MSGFIKSASNSRGGLGRIWNYMEQLMSWLAGAGKQLNELLEQQLTPKQAPLPERILTLRLIYKGKLLDTIRQGTDFTKEWFIGKSKRIFWQILGADAKFPDKHKFLQLDGEDYHLQLPSGATPLKFQRNGEVVDLAYLIRSRLLVGGTQLKLSPDMSGTIELNDNYQVHYGYFRPVRKIISPTEQAVLDRIAIPPEPDPIEARNRRIIMLSLLASLSIVFLFDILRTPVTPYKPLEEVLKGYAQVINPGDPTGSQNTEDLESGLPGEPSAGSRERRKPGSVTKPTTSNQSGDPSGGGSGNGQFRTYSYSGSNSGGSAGGFYSFVVRGTGSNTLNPRGGNQQNQNVENSPDPFEPDNNGGGGGGNVGRPGGNALSTYTPGSGSNLPQPEGDTRGDTRSEQIATAPVVTPNYPRYKQATASIPNLPVLNVPTIIASGGNSAIDPDNVAGQLDAKKGQLKQAYFRHYARTAQKGSLIMEFIIKEDGSAAAQLSPSESLTNAFLEEARAIVNTWSFNVSRACRAKYSLRLYPQ